MSDAPPPASGGAGRRATVAQAVADAADSVPGARRDGGAGIRIATQFRGGTILGVRLDADVVEVHIVVEDLRVLRVADAVTSAVTGTLRSLGDARPVVVHVDDIDVDDRSEVDADGRSPAASR